VRTLELGLLRTLVAIADRDTFALAADHVHRTQSAVTQQMARLEEQLGVALFHKVGRSKRLSEHGVRLLDYARRLLALNEEALQAIAVPELSGPLRIGSTYDAAEFMLPPLLARFSQLYPEVRIEVHAARSAHLMSALERGEIEIGLVATPVGMVAPAGPRVRLRTSPMVWMAAADYIHDRAQPVPLVLPSEPSGYRATAVAVLDAHGISWRIRHVSTSLAFGGLRATVRTGLGVTVRTIEMLGPELRVVSEAEGLPPLPNICHDLYLSDERASPPARRLFESLAEVGVRQAVPAHAAPARRRSRGSGRGKR
jgi:DNA-binding transcriptional LysR family regulator